MEDNGVGNKNLLVAGSNERCRKICEWIWYVPKDKELYKITSGQTDGEEKL